MSDSGWSAIQTRQAASLLSIKWNWNSKRNWPSLVFFPSNRFSVDNPCIVCEKSVILHSNNYWRCLNNLQLLSRKEREKRVLEKCSETEWLELRAKNCLIIIAYSGFVTLCKSKCFSMRRNVICCEIILRTIFVACVKIDSVFQTSIGKATSTGVQTQLARLDANVKRITYDYRARWAKRWTPENDFCVERDAFCLASL